MGPGLLEQVQQPLVVQILERPRIWGERCIAPYLAGPGPGELDHRPVDLATQVARRLSVADYSRRPAGASGILDGAHCDLWQDVKTNVESTARTLSNCNAQCVRNP